VCAVLDITEGNQRVLLHRARTRIRAILEQEVRP
jgi:RNA polymerase sigma-70 factor (ECF subfamily)